MNKFKNKILILMGDVQQIAPVILYGNKLQKTAASIYCSDFMQHFKIVVFTENMRLITNGDPDELEYAQTIDDMGSGNITNNTPLATAIAETTNEDGTTSIALHLPFTRVQEDALTWAYPDGFDPEIMHGVCILAATNDLVDKWNSYVQAMNDNPTHTLLSYDKISDVDDPHGIIESMIDDRLMTDYHDPQAPPHVLKLKVDDICILLRHVNKEAGYTNNKRVRVISIGKKHIRVRTLDSVDGSKDESIPRYRFSVKMKFKCFTMMRSQFPLRLAYSLTLNKSQGQEFLKVLLDLTIPPFSHGHLYVALSRVRSRHNILLFKAPKEEPKPLTPGQQTAPKLSEPTAAEVYEQEHNCIVTNNVVYMEILSSVFI